MNRWTCDHRDPKRPTWRCDMPASDAVACMQGRHYFVRVEAGR